MTQRIDFDIVDGGSPINMQVAGDAEVMDFSVEPAGKGTTDYTELENKPSIEGVTLVGDVSLEDIGAADAEDVQAAQETADAALTASGKAVRFDAAQTLTDAQKAQARGNIGAADAADVGELKSAFDDLEQYVRDLSPVVTAGPSSVVSVSDAAPLDAEDVVISIEPVQSGSDPSPDNICPISGWTGANVSRTGKNLCPSVTRYNINNYITAPVFLKKDTIYTFSCESSTLPNAFYLRKSNVISTSSPVEQYIYNKRVWTFSPQENTQYIMQIYKGTSAGWGDETVTNPQLELGSTATAYEPYQGNTYSVTFPAAAGTIYGGTLDLTAGTLTVDRAIVDLGTLTWAYNTSLISGTPVFSSGNMPSRKVGSMNLVCENYASYDGVRANIPNASITSYNASNANAVIIRDDAYSDAATFKTAMSGVMLVYELATPVTYTLDPVTLTLLRGNNAVWADTGAATLTYRQDVATLLSALTAPDETDMTANANYAMNSFFTVGGTLYKATAAIATGETIAPGSNCTATTIADQLTYLYSQI